jgi:hypothetical protein
LLSRDVRRRAGLILLPVVLLPVAAVAAPGPEGAPDAAHRLQFGAILNASANWRDQPTLDSGSGTAISGRTSASLTWSLRSETSRLLASLTPYFERFTGPDRSLSTYGGSAGLGYQRRVEQGRTWDIAGTIRAAPEQDLEVPVTSDEPGAPETHILVPRNGLIATSLHAGLQQETGDSSRVAISVSGSNDRYNEYVVDDAGGVRTGLTDNRTIGMNLDWSVQSSASQSWSMGAGGSHHSLQGSLNTPDAPARDQYEAHVGSTRQLAEHSNLAVSFGVSTIDTGSGGRKDYIPALSARWAVTRSRLTSDLAFFTNQGIFPGTGTSTNFYNLTGKMYFRSGARSRINAAAGYTLSKPAGGGADADATHSRFIACGYSRSLRRLVWSVGASRSRQDAGLGPDLETTVANVSLGWTLTGGRS